MTAEPSTTPRAWPGLPHVSADLARIDGKSRVLPEDFRVDEVPAYAPAGRGEHLFVCFEKTALDTPAAVRRLADALGVDARQASWAGLKDRHAITTQWASFEGGDPDVALRADLEGIRVLAASRHPHKLRTGHLRANRFRLRLRDCSPAPEPAARRILQRLTTVGVPNYFGEQRFGHEGRNIEPALAWITERKRPPRDRFRRKLDVSVAQSAVFNDWLARRIDEGLYERALPGDLMRKEDTGGLFVTEDAAAEQTRMRAWEISPTGPIFGAKMRKPQDEAWQRELRSLHAWGLDEAQFARLKRFGPGSRRAMRVPLRDWHVREEDGCLLLAFELPKGSYATAVLRELLPPHAHGR